MNHDINRDTEDRLERKASCSSTWRKGWSYLRQYCCWRTSNEPSEAPREPLSPLTIQKDGLYIRGEQMVHPNNGKIGTESQDSQSRVSKPIISATEGDVSKVKGDKSSTEEIEIDREALLREIQSEFDTHVRDRYFIIKAGEWIKRYESLKENRSLQKAETLIKDINIERAELSKKLYEENYTNVPQVNGPVVTIISNDLGHSGPFPCYETTMMPVHGMMIIQQAYKEREMNPEQALPHSAMIAQQWRQATELTDTDPNCIRIIRDNNVTDVEQTINPIRDFLDLDKPMTEFNEGTPSFKQVSEKARLVKIKFRSIEQNTEIYGEKKIAKIIVDHNLQESSINKDTLKGISIRYVIKNR